MKKSNNKRRWWRFGGWLSDVPEPETDMGKLRRRMRLWSCVAAVATGAGALLVFSSGSADLSRPFAVLTGISVGLCLLSVMGANARPASGVRNQVLAAGGALLPGLGMAWLFTSLSWLSLLVTLSALALFLCAVWAWAEPRPISRRLSLVSHIVNLACQDLVKGSLLLCGVPYLLFLVSTPFRPLAIQPPPAELVARYVPTLKEPSPDGTAYRMLMGLADAGYRERYGITNAIIAEGWHERWESFSRAPMGLNGMTI